MCFLIKKRWSETRTTGVKKILDLGYVMSLNTLRKTLNSKMTSRKTRRGEEENSTIRT